MNKKKKTLLIVSTVFCLSAVGAVVFSSAGNHKSADIVKSENETYTLLLNYNNKPAAAGTSEEPTTFNYTPSRFTEFKYENVYKAHDTESIKRHISIANGGSISAKVCGLSTIRAAWGGEGALTIWYGVNSADEHAIRAVNGTTYNLFGNYIKLASTTGNKIEDIDFTITYSCGEETSEDNKVFSEDFSSSDYDHSNFSVDEFGSNRCSSTIADGTLTMTPSQNTDYKNGLHSANKYNGNYTVSIRLKNPGSDNRVMFYLGMASTQTTYSQIVGDTSKGSSFELIPGNQVRANGGITVSNSKIPSPKEEFVDYQLVAQSNGTVRIFANNRLLAQYTGMTVNGYFGLGTSSKEGKDIYTIDSISANPTDDYSADENYSSVVNSFDYVRDNDKGDQVITYEESEGVLHIKGATTGNGVLRHALVANAYLTGDYIIEVGAKTNSTVETNGRINFYIGSSSFNTHWTDTTVTNEFIQLIPNNTTIKTGKGGGTSVTAKAACPDMTDDFVTFKFEVSTTNNKIKVFANNIEMYTFEGTEQAPLHTEGYFRLGGGANAVEAWINSFSITPIE